MDEVGHLLIPVVAQAEDLLVLEMLHLAVHHQNAVFMVQVALPLPLLIILAVAVLVVRLLQMQELETQNGVVEPVLE